MDYGTAYVRRYGPRYAAVYLIGLLVALVWVNPVTVQVGVGSFKLSVHVASQGEKPRSVTCEVFSSRKEAEEVLEYLVPPEIKSRSASADPFVGQPLTVTVMFTTRETSGGRLLKRRQFEYLVVIATMPNGERVGKLEMIPDGRVSQELVVVLP